MQLTSAIYGMNFEFMPELQWTYAYPAFWVLNFIVMVVIVRFFWKRHYFEADFGTGPNLESH